MKILIVEDDDDLRRVIADKLEKDGYQVEGCGTGGDALYYIDSAPYDIILLDRMLPEVDGMTLLNEIRSRGLNTPVIMVTAMNGINDRVDGLDMGADDYLVKPFAVEELEARIRALLRRPRQLGSSSVLTYGDIELDLTQFKLRCRDKQVKLSKKERGLIEYLVKNADNIVSREQILSRVWGADVFVEEGSVDTYVCFVRRRLRAVSSRVAIKNIHGIGYRMEMGTEDV